MLKKINTFALSIIVSFAAGAIGSFATIPNIPTWYAALKKPVLNPPNWVFGPVWSLLYLLMGIALALVITKQTNSPKKAAYILFVTQLVLNALWSLIFFGLHATFAGAVIIVALLITIIVTIRLFYNIDKPAAILLIPYLAWVSFATYLNFGIAVFN